MIPLINISMVYLLSFALVKNMRLRYTVLAFIDSQTYEWVRYVCRNIFRNQMSKTVQDRATVTIKH